MKTINHQTTYLEPNIVSVMGTERITAMSRLTDEPVSRTVSSPLIGSKSEPGWKQIFGNIGVEK